MPIFSRLAISHRTLPEQLVGLGIYLLISLGAQLLSGFGLDPLSTSYFVCLSLSMWVLWRSYSLRVLKLELSLFLSQVLFHIGWGVSSFLFHQSLLALVTLLLLWTNTLIAALLFWKKQRLAAILLFFPLLRILYFAALHMLELNR